MTDNQLQSEHKEWVDREYPGQPAFVPAAGMVEEAGELLHAVLKMECEKLWGKERRQGDLHAKLMDAVGDCAIFCCSYCNATNQVYNSKREAYPGSGSTVELAVQFVRSAAMHATSTYESYATDVYMGLLCHISAALGVDFDDAVEVTWNEVKKRTRLC